MDIASLILGFLFAFILPGFLIIQTFYKAYPTYLKIPLVILTSVLVSTWLTYFLFHMFGHSRLLLQVVAFILLISSLITYHKANLSIPRYYKKVLLAAFTLLALFLIALYPSIYRFKGGNVVMGSVNWQDTAMHLGIIESIAQGNFPPNAPYYAGVPLTYYYFADFHSAIITIFYDNFFPRVLVYANPMFALLLFLSVFAFAYELIKIKQVAFNAALFSIFFSSYSFVLFLKDLAVKPFDKPVFAQILSLVTANSYSLDYGKFFQVVSVVDYLLQNRPMMVGLSGLTMATLLLFRGIAKAENKTLLLAGLVIALTSKFQFFTMIVFALFCLVSFFHFLIKGSRFTTLVKAYLITLAPLVFFVLPTSTAKINDRSLVQILIKSFKLEGFGSENGIFWILKFVFANLGIVWLLFVVGIVMILFQKSKQRGTLFMLSLWATVLVSAPFLVRFTVYEGDMFKFFYFASIPVAIVAAYTLQRVAVRWRKSGTALTTLVFLLLLFSPMLVLANSFLNENIAYSGSDHRVGLWIRENTPSRSVFLALPTVHSPITQIGGRLRVLSYITWPYSHGYNEGTDNVFTRRDEIESIYENPANQENLVSVITKYQVDYVYVGQEETHTYPDFRDAVEKPYLFEKVYEEGKITIYKVLI